MVVAHGLANTLNVVANLLIVVGYVLVPIFWLPYLPLTKPVLFSGVAFFLTCATTHVALVFGLDHHGPWVLANHVVQAVAVLAFVIGFSRLLKRADTIRRRGGVDDQA